MCIRREALEIESAVDIAAPPERVWPLLCGARMVLAAGVIVRAAVGRPLECSRDADGRECRTSRGACRQRITRWEEPVELQFERMTDTLGLGWFLRSIRDTFLLRRLSGGGTRLIRRTRFDPRCGARSLLRCVVPRIQRYVNANFKAIAEGAA
jgi:hypothetical protein